MPEYEILLHGDTWDATTGRTPDQWIAIQDGRIEGTYDDQPGDAPITRTAALFTPGLIDMHVHLVWDGTDDPVATLEREHPHDITIRAVENAMRTVRGGVTTIRDLGSTLDIAINVARAIRQGRIPGATTYASGQTIIITGGHDPFWGIPSDGPAACRHTVRTLRSRGADLIKVSATGGVYGQAIGEKPGVSELSLDELTAIVDEASRFGLPVAAHAVGREGITNAVEAGVSTLEHGNLMDRPTLEKLIADDILYVPTLYIYREVAVGDADVPAYARENALTVYEQHANVFKDALAMGARIAAGSDAGSPGTPHPAIHEELLALVDHGMEPVDALTAATLTPAAELGRPDLGTLEPGTPADIVGFPADPLADIGIIETPSLILKDGDLITDTPQATT